MSNGTEFTSNGRTLKDRVRLFHDCMAPAMSVLPTNIVEQLKIDGFFTSPASTKYHGAYEGGLFDHSLNVALNLVKLTQVNDLFWIRPESPYIVGMFHDICKQDQYRHPIIETQYFHDDGSIYYPIDESRWEYASDLLLKGHGDKSVMLLSQYLTLTMEEILCIRYHMGAFVDQKEWNDYTRAIHQYPNVLWTHMADMIAAHVLEIDK